LCVCVPPVVSYLALLSSIHLSSRIRLERECTGRCPVNIFVNRIGLEPTDNSGLRHVDLGLLVWWISLVRPRMP
jgi:hypothetical protein